MRKIIMTVSGVKVSSAQVPSTISGMAKTKYQTRIKLQISDITKNKKRRNLNRLKLKKLSTKLLQKE